MNHKQCKTCQGIGFVKNIFIKCEICDGTKCEYYQNHKNEPYVNCEKCSGDGNILNPETNNLNLCGDCRGTGFIENNIKFCKDCTTQHNICYCYINLSPYKECFECEGSGKK